MDMVNYSVNSSNDQAITASMLEELLKTHSSEDDQYLEDFGEDRLSKLYYLKSQAC